MGGAGEFRSQNAEVRTSAEHLSNGAGPRGLHPASLHQSHFQVPLPPFAHFHALDPGKDVGEARIVPFGGVLVSTCQVRQRRHAEDDALAS